MRKALGAWILALLLVLPGTAQAEGNACPDCGKEEGKLVSMFSAAWSPTGEERPCSQLGYGQDQEERRIITRNYLCGCGNAYSVKAVENRWTCGGTVEIADLARYLAVLAGAAENPNPCACGGSYFPGAVEYTAWATQKIEKDCAHNWLGSDYLQRRRRITTLTCFSCGEAYSKSTYEFQWVCNGYS